MLRTHQDKPIFDLNQFFKCNLFLFSMIIGNILGKIGYHLIINLSGLSKITGFHTDNVYQFIPDTLRISFLVKQICIVVGNFGMGSYIFIKCAQYTKNFISLRKIDISLLGLIMIILITSMVLNTLLIEINVWVRLPNFLKDFEQWAQTLERFIHKETAIVFNTSNVFVLFITCLSFTVIPALFEELFFRGILQTLLYESYCKTHFAVLLNGFIFSALHFQFYGFFARMFLGSLFGYMYIWTKNLWYPIIAHFFNNFFTLIFMFIYFEDFLKSDPLIPASYPHWIHFISLSIFIPTWMLFKHHSQKNYQL